MAAFVAGLMGHSSTAAATTSYSTQPGETREVWIADGTLIHLNTRSHIEWMESISERRVMLNQGEVYFSVIEDHVRPFRVSLTHSEIQTSAGHFNVHEKDNGEVVVTVVAGSVLVRGYAPNGSRVTWQRDVLANQTISYRRKGVIDDVHAVDAVDALRWRDGVLEIKNERLPDVLDELRRYTDRRIVIHDWRLKQLRVGGILSTRDVRAALKRLEKLAPIAVTERESELVLKYRD
jgi:transmembrane sensor